MQAKITELANQLKSAVNESNYRKIQYLLKLIRENGHQVVGRLNCKKAELIKIAQVVLAELSQPQQPQQPQQDTGMIENQFSSLYAIAKAKGYADNEAETFARKVIKLTLNGQYEKAYKVYLTRFIHNS